MKRGSTGRYDVTIVGDEAVNAFVPEPLPPRPALALHEGLQSPLEAALLALGRLDGVATLLPDKRLFLYAYVRKEAVLSSRIEGTQSSLSDLLLFELDDVPGVPLHDVIEVSNYVAALDHGLARLRGGFPLSNRLIRRTAWPSSNASCTPTTTTCPCSFAPGSPTSSSRPSIPSSTATAVSVAC